MCHQYKDYRTVFKPSSRDTFMKPLGLHYCDSGALFTLLSNLGSLDVAKLHTKVNQYFFQTFGAIGIIMECVPDPKCIKVRAIGRAILPEPLKFKSGCDTALRLIETKGAVRLEKGQLEGKLSCHLDKVLREEYKEKFLNSMFFPIEHPLEKEKYTYYIGLVNFKDFEGCDDVYFAIVAECLRHCYGMLRSAANYEEEKLNSKKCKTILNSFIEVLSWAGSKVVYEKVQQQAIKIFDAANCTVFIHNPEFILVPKVVAGGHRITFKEEEAVYHTTTAAKVAQIGQLINIPCVQEDPLYSPANVPFTGDCRSLMSFPLIMKGKLLGVIEVYDKNTTSSTFTEDDIEMTVPFTNTIASAIKANVMFYHFYHLKTKQQFLDCILLRRFKDVDAETLRNVLNCHDKHNFPRITDFRFDPRMVPEKHVLCVCLTIFECSGLIKKLRIQKEMFVRFLIKLKEAHSALPFHNWEHAFLTFHFVFICVNQYNLIKDKFVTVFEYFTLLMAALCHGLDHRGPTTMFDMAAGTVLASLLSSSGSISQRHHLSQALRLMTYPECNILQHIDNEEFLTFAELLGGMIEDTNMALHPQKMAELEEMMQKGYDKSNIEHRRLFHFLIINCAQTCYSCKPWQLSRKIGEDCFQEFFRKGDLNYAQGVFDVPDFNEDMLKLPEMNCHFIETICLPSFKAPRDITKLQKDHEKKTRKSRRQEFLKLFYSNPQKLLSLIKELHGDCTISQQIKVNLYLQDETGCCLSFLIEKCHLYREHVIKVIGSRELSNQVRFEENNEFMKRFENIDGPVTLRKELLCSSLLVELTTVMADFKLTDTVSCHFFPIFHPYRKNVIFYACLVQDDHNPNNIETIHGYVGECFRYCQEIIVNTMRYNEQRQVHSKQKLILEIGMTNLDLIENFPGFIFALRQQILDISEAERCNLYFLEGNLLVSRISDHGVSFDTFKKDIKNVRIPVGVSIPGVVAETGKGINCLDPQNDAIYRKDLDIVGGLLTRNLLCFPLMLYGRVYGVVEAFNKINCNIFSGADLYICEQLGQVLGIQLYMALVTKKNRDDYSRRDLIDFFMLEPSVEVEESELNFVENCQFRHDYESLLDYMLIPPSVKMEHNMCTILHMFEDLELLEKIAIDRTAFISFLLTVRRRYQEFSFHGWQHAFNTMLFVYTIIKKENIIQNEGVSAMECFCILLAALCHEMEYRGSTSPFKPTSGTTLGSLYSSAGSVVQFHSIDQTIRLLGDFSITNDMDLKQFKALLINLDTMILGMDLGNHIHNINTLKKLIEDRKILKVPENRRYYFGLLLTCSDISDFCKPWQYLETQGAKISDEFFIEEVPPECYGLIEFSDMFENVKLKKILLQIHFMQTICEPAFSLLNTVLPRTDKCSEAVEFNIRTLQSTKEKVIQAQLEETA